MVIDKIDALLNDAEINYICDLFLFKLGFERTSANYRYFRNAVIFASHGLMKATESYALLAECAGLDRETYKSKLKAALSELPVPVHEAFNAAFVTRDENGLPVSPVMRQAKLNETVSFLGTVFMYIIVSYYPKYELVALRKNDAGT